MQSDVPERIIFEVIGGLQRKKIIVTLVKINL
jgi:hypothetical protein